MDITRLTDDRLAVLDFGAVIVIDQGGRIETLPMPDLLPGDDLAERLDRLSDGTPLVGGQASVGKLINGRVQRLAGAIDGGTTADGVPARRADLLPADIVGLPSGGFLVADRRTSSIRRVDAQGTITTFAGNRQRSSPADGAIAAKAPLPRPTAVSVAPSGRVLIASMDGVVRSVDSDGRIHTVVGGGARPALAAGIPASEVRLRGIRDVAELDNGELAIVDRDGVYSLNRDGLVVRLTRAHTSWYDSIPYQYGLPSSRATLDSPTAVASDPQGGVVIATTRSVALISPDGDARRHAVNIAPNTLRLIRRGKVVLHATVGGTATLTLRRGRRRVATAVRTIPAGRSVLRIRGNLASRVHLLTVALRADDGRLAADGLPVLPGRQLALRDAAKTLLPEVVQDHSDIGIDFQVLRCIRKARLAVSCLFRAYDSESRPSRASEWFRVTARLRVGADGKPRVRGTARTRRRARIVLFR